MKIGGKTKKMKKMRGLSSGHNFGWYGVVVTTEGAGFLMKLFSNGLLLGRGSCLIV